MAALLFGIAVVSDKVFALPQSVIP